MKMNTLCCQPCRLRFADAAAYLTACPECGGPATPTIEPRRLVGFRLFDPLDITDIVPGTLPRLPPAPHQSRP
ncbi:MAG: hypothetical protein ACJ780_00355 [Solirubrobacteraceae bacterium]